MTTPATLLALAVEESPSLIAVLNERGAMQYANPRFRRLFGLGEADWNQIPLPLLFPPACQAEFFGEAYRAALREGRPWQMDVQFPRPDGAATWIGIRLTPTRSPESPNDYFVLTAADITLQKERGLIEEWRRSARELANRLLHSAMQQISLRGQLYRALKLLLVMSRIPNRYHGGGIFLFEAGNADAQALHGATREGLERDLQRFHQRLRGEPATPDSVIDLLRFPDDPPGMEHLHLMLGTPPSPMGVVILHVHDWRGVEPGEEEYLEGFRQTLNNIIERTRQDENVKLSQMRLISAIESIADGFAIFDQEERLQLWNSTFHGIHDRLQDLIVEGMSFGEFIGACVSRGQVALGGGSREAWLRQRMIHFLGERGGLEVPYNHDRWLLISERRMESGGTVEIYTDITPQKKLQAEMRLAREEAIQANRAKSDFLANMSHEIRTPLNAIINFSRLTRQTAGLTVKQRSYLDNVESAGNILLGVINDILDFSKIEAGHLALESIPFHLDDVIHNVTGIAAARKEGKDLELLHQISPATPRLLLGDPLRLGQVLINLVTNAVKFTPQGEVVLRVEPLSQEGGEVALRFSVRDTGIGLSLAQQARLFQPFSQADASTTRHHGGAGLGLAISKRLVEMMKGSIGVESVPGEGSLFSFTARFPIQSAATPPPLVAPTLRGVRALVVDDNPTARDILQSVLESFQMRVTAVESGAAALAVLESATAHDPYPLIFLDYQMEGLDGLETARRIRANPRLANAVGLLMVTAHGREEVQREAKRIGINGFLVKPVSPSLLLEAILEARGEAPQRMVEAAGQDRFQAIRGARVLLVEDNPMNQEIGRELLLQAGVVPILATSGGEALAKLERDPPFDLVLMDIQMPEMDGLETTRRILAEERFRELPILAMTAHAMSGDREKSLAVGMRDHLTKPIDPMRLAAALTTWIPPHPPGVGRRPEEALSPPAEPPKAGETPGGDGWSPPPEVIDLADGLNRLGGNRPLYLKLLRRFRADNAALVDPIRPLLAHDNLDAARLLVHTLKGNAGSLGMAPLFRAGQLLEQALSARERHAVNAATPPFLVALERTLAALSNLPGEGGEFADDPPLPADGENRPDDAIPPEAAALAREMLSLLDRDIAAAQDCLKQLRPLLVTVPNQRWFRELSHRMEAFDTDQAEEMLRAMLEKPDHSME
ncbi:MAG: response regulator [Magnetococcales bacterium]|nr:response regulator [Magnetococcales bacterium]